MMHMTKNIITAAAATMILSMGFVSCAWDPSEHDADPVAETMDLEVSSDSISLDENDLTATVLTFKWTPAHSVSEDFIVSYTTKLDVVGNNFGSKTALITTEDAGVYERSYTSEQLNNWANQRWSLPVNKEFSLEFRVVAQYAGGKTFEMPEVRTATVKVHPIKVDIFAADNMYIDGTASAERIELEKTIENNNVYAWHGNLSAGELQIPVLFEGQSYYLVPKDGSSALHDGIVSDVTMKEAPTSWNIPSSGQYRIVINMADKNICIYSSATDMKPRSVTFRPNGDMTKSEITMEVSDLYAYGGGTGWGVKTLGLKASQADPQILIYDASEHNGAKISGSMKFCVSRSFTIDGVSYNQNNSYCFTCPLTAEGGSQNISLEIGKTGELHGGAERNVRNSYYTIPSSDYLIFNLREETILAKNKE